MTVAFVPNDLDIKGIVAKHPPCFRYDVEAFYYIISSVLSRMQYVQAEEKSLDGFASVSSRLLQARIHNYRPYLTYLIDNGVLLCNRHYIPGEKSRSYKVPNHLLHGGFRQIRLTKKGLIRYMPEELSRREYLEQNYHYLTRWFNDHLEIDYKSALTKLNALYDHDLKSREIENAERRLYIRQLALDKFQGKQFTYSVDSTIRRFYSNIIFLKSELRQYITYAGQPLKFIDVKNSQPFISMALFNSDFYIDKESEFSLYTVNQEVYKANFHLFPSILSLLPPPSSYIMLVKQNLEVCDNDLELYCTLVDKGWLYGYFAEQLKKSGGPIYNVKIAEEKRSLKNKFFGVLYSHRNTMVRADTPEMSTFTRLFPTVTSIFKLLKKVQKNHLPIILQSLESQVILRVVAKRFSELYREAPIFSVHDSLATTEEYELALFQLMKECFTNATGFTPSLDPDLRTLQH